MKYMLVYDDEDNDPEVAVYKNLGEAQEWATLIRDTGRTVWVKKLASVACYMPRAKESK